MSSHNARINRQSSHMTTGCGFVSFLELTAKPCPTNWTFKLSTRKAKIVFPRLLYKVIFRVRRFFLFIRLQFTQFFLYLAFFSRILSAPFSTPIASPPLKFLPFFKNPSADLALLFKASLFSSHSVAHFYSVYKNQTGKQTLQVIVSLIPGLKLLQLGALISIYPLILKLISRINLK